MDRGEGLKDGKLGAEVDEGNLPHALASQSPFYSAHYLRSKEEAEKV